MQRKLTVSQLNKYISGVFDDETVLHDVTVCGEVYECKRYGARTFITLREGDCTLSCVSFGALDNISEGMSVDALGTVTFYAGTGKVSFVTERMEPVGKGKLMLELLKLREKLKFEGLFENRPRLPDRINKVALITSEHGAVLHDVVSVVRAKNPYLDLCVCDVRVQGTESAGLIAEAVKNVNTMSDIDAIIIARGGGSAYDLQAYNTETVARAVAYSRIPVVSAVGHETDYTLCDLCASARAGTPSIAADMVCEPVTEKLARLRGLAEKLTVGLSALYFGRERAVIRAATAVVGLSELTVSRRMSGIGFIASKMSDRISGICEKRENELSKLAAMLDRASPFKILSRGYAKICKDGREIVSVRGLSVGDEISVRMADGKINAKVIDNA